MVLVNHFIVVQILFCETRVNDVFDFGLHFNHINTARQIFFILMLDRHGYVFEIRFFIVWISDFFNDSIHKSVKARLLENQLFPKLAEASKIVVAPLAYYGRIVVVVFQLKEMRHDLLSKIADLVLHQSALALETESVRWW